MFGNAIKLNYEDTDKFVNIYISNPMSKVWSIISDEFGTRSSDRFYLDEAYIDEYIGTNDKRIADLLYFYSELKEDYRVFLKMKWNFGC